MRKFRFKVFEKPVIKVILSRNRKFTFISKCFSYRIKYLIADVVSIELSLWNQGK